MTRPNSSPLIRMQSCVCGEKHPVHVVVMGTTVVECPKLPPNSGLHIDQTTEFPRTWYLRQGVKVEKAVEEALKEGKKKK